MQTHTNPASTPSPSHNTRNRLAKAAAHHHHQQPAMSPLDRHNSHVTHKHSTLSRRFSLNASVRKQALEEDHEVALDQFRLRVAQAGLQLPPALICNGDVDATLLRFLRARKWHVEAAFTMLEKSLAWRARVGADTALEHPLDPQLMQLVRECRPSSYIGFDSQHHPIFLERLGKLDGVRIEREGVADDTILAYHLREMEYMAQVVFTEASAAAGHTIDRVISIMDADGLTLSKLSGFAQRLFRLITAMDSDNYPETCHAIYIVNGGVAFGAIWRIVSPFVDKGTRDKVHVVGSGKYMQQHLFSGIGREMTPTFLGGDLDFDSTARQWWDKMDAAITERQANPKGHQQPIVLQVPASVTNGHAAEPHQPHRSSFSGSFTGLKLPRLLHLGSSGGGGLHRHSNASVESAESYGTPMSAVSRFSAVSVYFDAVEADAPGGPPGPSPPSSLGGMDPHHGTASPPAGSSPRHLHAAAAAAAAMAGGSSPLGAGSTPGGSMSVGPQSCSRSQLSGFTLGTAHGPGGGAGRHPEMHEVDGHGAGADDDLRQYGSSSQQPACGCRCVIS